MATIPRSGTNINSLECFAKSAAGIGAVKQSLRSTCPVNHAGGAANTDQRLSNPKNNGSQFVNATRPTTLVQDISIT